MPVTLNFPSSTGQTINNGIEFVVSVERIKTLAPIRNDRIIVLLGGLGLLSVYYAIFGQFMPNSSGGMGHDYGLGLPALLDGYFWFHANGLLEIPWFTPSFCGGSLTYANINNGYYSTLQFLAFVVDPVTAVRLNFIFYAGMGMLGFYVLLRSGFQFGRTFSFLGASIFLFNGFFSHRMIIGHLGFCFFMLIPFVAFFFLRPICQQGKSRTWQLIFDMIAGGLLFSAMIQGGFSSMMMPAIISILILGLTHNLAYGRHRDFWIRFIGGGFFGVLFCLSKLVTIYYLMTNFPRSDYLLPGAKTFLHAAWLAVKSLFISPSVDLLRTEALTNMQWALDRHEWEYDVTLVPLILLLYGLWGFLKRCKKGEISLHMNHWTRILQGGLLIILLAIPVAVNTYSPGWNEILKHVPLIKNSSSLIRWFIIYIPLTILLSVLVIEKSGLTQKTRLIITLLGISAVILLNTFTDRNFYNSQSYDPDEVVSAFYRIQSNSLRPEIKTIGVYRDEKGNILTPAFRNNALIHGASQLFCYEPMFGYRLENFPIKALHPGPVLMEENGAFNIKNPACYVWPEENDCVPGDHFTSAQKDAAEDFINYRPYEFKTPLFQKLANWINGLSLIGALIFFLFYVGKTVLFHRMGKAKPASLE